MNRFLFLCLIALATLCLSSAFHKTSSLRRFKTSYNMALTEISSTGGLDEAVTAAGDKLLVIDYSTTWCGPCKVALPKFVGKCKMHYERTFPKKQNIHITDIYASHLHRTFEQIYQRCLPEVHWGHFIRGIAANEA